MVSPNVEFANSVWCPFKLGDIEEIEKIQNRATKLIIKLKHKLYQERLIHLNLPMLNYRLRGDMTEVLKIINNIYDAKVSPQLILNKRANTRGNNYNFLTILFIMIYEDTFFCSYCKYMEQFAKFCC